MSQCTFNDCNKPALFGSDKCSFHKNRRQCKAPDCRNQVYARGVCVRHGGKKPCQIQGCTLFARGGVFCISHGGYVVKRFCNVDGCFTQAHARNLCVRHGGGRLCYYEGCRHHAREGGWCTKHRAFAVKPESSAPSSPAKDSSVQVTDNASPKASPTELYNEWIQLTHQVVKSLQADFASALLEPMPEPSLASPNAACDSLDWQFLLDDIDFLSV
ncbi:unnamed protein product [Aphanomyces euteiches]